jgi:hypothetical protein
MYGMEYSQPEREREEQVLSWQRKGQGQQRCFGEGHDVLLVAMRRGAREDKETAIFQQVKSRSWTIDARLTVCLSVLFTSFTVDLHGFIRLPPT